MNSDPVNVLFTSAGRRVELLRAFRRALSDLGLEGTLVAADIDPLAPALHECDRSFIVPPLSDPEYVPALVEICRRERVRLVFPLIDPDIPVLAAHREQFAAVGAQAVVVSPQAAATTADKWKTYCLFVEQGIPTPQTWLGQEVWDSPRVFPLIVKPRFGSAGKSAFRITDERELAFFLDHVPDPVSQEWVHGPEITCDVVSDFAGHVLGIACRERLEVRWGEVAKGRTVIEDAALRGCVKIAHALEAIGPITVQCIAPAGRPRFTEVNARFGGGAPLGFAAGVRSPQWLLALAAGRSIQVPPLGTYREGLYLTRFDCSLIFEEETRARVARHNI